ncbi:MAG: NBR1-Ig-like domain-containing protein [Anaerolineales bacterium]
MNSKNRAFPLISFTILALTLACVRTAPTVQDDTQSSIETADAEVQLTLEALLASATADSAPTATAQPTSTLLGAQLTELAGTLTAAAVTPTPGPSEEIPPTESSTPEPTGAPCLIARYVYDETYPDGTRVDPGQAMAKTWRLQNVGTCDWAAGQYELIFIGGDKMQGQSPWTITFTVPAGGYANFTMNMTAPAQPGTYHGDWMLRTKGGDTFGVGPNADLPIWIEIIVRG